VLGGVMLATVYMLSAEARTAKTDATLLLTIILAMGAMARAWLGQAKGWACRRCSGRRMAAGILVKGPGDPSAGGDGGGLGLGEGPEPVLAEGAAPPARDRLDALLTLPWFIAIMIRTEGAFLMASIGGDLAEKMAATGEHSGIPPGFYLLTVWATLWPWTLLLPLALVTGWTMRKAARGRVPPGLDRAHMAVFEAVSTKLIHYTLPTYPALLLLAAVPLVKLIDGERAFRGWAAHVGTVGFVLGTLVFAVLAIGAPMAYGDGHRPVATHGRHGPDARWPILAVVAFYRAGDARHRGPRAAGIVMAWTLTAPACPRAGVLGHAAPGGGDGRRSPALRRRPPSSAHGAEPGVPVRHRYAASPTRKPALDMAGRGAGPRRVDRSERPSRGHRPSPRHTRT
jgi:hypothetical protein